MSAHPAHRNELLVANGAEEVLLLVVVVLGLEVHLRNVLCKCGKRDHGNFEKLMYLQIELFRRAVIAEMAGEGPLSCVNQAMIGLRKERGNNVERTTYE